MSVADGARKRLGRRLLAAQLQPQHAGHSRRRKSRIGKRRKLDQPGAMLEVHEQMPRGSYGERGLPHPPAPVRVTTRYAETRSRTRCTAVALPTSLLTISGKLLGLRSAGRSLALAAGSVSVAPSCRTVQLPSRRYPRPADVFSKPRSGHRRSARSCATLRVYPDCPGPRRVAILHACDHNFVGDRP